MEKMDDILIVRDARFLEHVAPRAHPECPERLVPLHQAFESEARLKALPQLEVSRADDEILEKVHAKELVQQLSGIRGDVGWIDPDTYFGPKSVEVAYLAAGSTIDLAKRIWNKECRRGFSFVRPPGHHATPSAAMGFCLLNNVALATQALLEEDPQSRIAVVDFDLHHGNGTQDCFYQNPRVLFVSSHRYPYYPGSGAVNEVGNQAGEGTTVNFPLGRPFESPLFVELYLRCVVPVLREFSPDMIVVSAGFDGHKRDPMQGFQIDTETFGLLAESLILVAESSCEGRILFCLEGGYSPEALRDSSISVLDKMMTVPRKKAEMGSAVSQTGQVEEFIGHFRQYFPTLQ